jgi:hypothetical protein
MQQVSERKKGIQFFIPAMIKSINWEKAFLIAEELILGILLVG